MINSLEFPDNRECYKILIVWMKNSRAKSMYILFLDLASYTVQPLICIYWTTIRTFLNKIPMKQIQHIWKFSERSNNEEQNTKWKKALKERLCVYMKKVTWCMEGWKREKGNCDIANVKCFEEKHMKLSKTHEYDRR